MAVPTLKRLLIWKKFRSWQPCFESSIWMNRLKMSLPLRKLSTKNCFPFKALGYIGHHILKLNQWRNINKMKLLYQVNEDTVRLFDARSRKKGIYHDPITRLLSLEWRSATREESCRQEVDSLKLKLNAQFILMPMSASAVHSVATNSHIIRNIYGASSLGS